MDAIDPRRVEIDGHRFQLRPWGVEEGRRWLYRLLKAAASANGAGVGAAAIGAVLSGMSEDTFLQLCTVIEKYTDVVGERDGRETLVPLSKLSPELMRRNHFVLFRLGREHLTDEYGSFFGRAGELLAGLGDEAK